MSSEKSWAVGQHVRALQTITEGGEGEGDENAPFPDSDYIHAHKDDVGEVVHVDGDGVPTVRFERTRTSTCVGDTEVELVPEQADNKVSPLPAL